MKPPVTKADLRRELDHQVDTYLRDGGQVHEIPRGVSGRNPVDGPLPNPPFVGSYAKEGGAKENGEPDVKEGRVYLTDVIAAIEARRKPPAVTTKRVVHRARKKFIYDDFGEPIRWVWEE